MLLCFILLLVQLLVIMRASKSTLWSECIYKNASQCCCNKLRMLMLMLLLLLLLDKLQCASKLHLRGLIVEQLIVSAVTAVIDALGCALKHVLHVRCLFCRLNMNFKQHNTVP
jgi:hypothetical protein